MLFQACKIIVISVLASVFIPTIAVSQQLTVKKFVDQIRSQFVEALSKPGENQIELLVSEIQFKLKVVYEIGADGKIDVYVLSVGANVKTKNVQEITFTAKIKGGPITVEAPSESKKLYAFRKKGDLRDLGVFQPSPAPSGVEPTAFPAQGVPVAIGPSAIPAHRAPAAVVGPVFGRSLSGSPLPLLVIRFGDFNIRYDLVLFSAVSEVLKRKPDARFEVVALLPGKLDPVALAISKGRAEEVISKLKQIGVPKDHISQSTIFDPLIQSTQIYVFAR